jgi:hypothetical protein
MLHYVLALLYSAVPLTYFCGHLLDINKIILSNILIYSMKILYLLKFSFFLKQQSSLRYVGISSEAANSVV